MLDEDDNGYKAGRFLRASDLGMESENLRTIFIF
jgi:nitrate reductase alpha subunit